MNRFEADEYVFCRCRGVRTYYLHATSMLPSGNCDPHGWVSDEEANIRPIMCRPARAARPSQRSFKKHGNGRLLLRKGNQIELADRGLGRRP